MEDDTHDASLQDTTAGYLYSNMALSMCELVGDMSPDVAVSCKFLKQIRQNPQAKGLCNPPRQATPGQSAHDRYMEIVGFMMMCMRSQHLQHKEQAWPQQISQVIQHVLCVISWMVCPPWFLLSKSMMKLCCAQKSGISTCDSIMK